MATYFFETITDAQAAAYVAATDELVFQNPAERATTTSVAFGGAGIVVTSGLTGRSVTFGTGLAGEAAVMPNGATLVIGTTGDDDRNAGGASDAAYGGGGNDTLNGGVGDDLLQGNGGNDSLIGDTGNDTIYGGQQDDMIVVGAEFNFAQGNLGNDTISVGGVFQEGTNTMLGGQGDDMITGGGFGDFLNGNLGGDTINGGDGGDRMFGEGGADRLFGEAGADSIDAGEGDDRIEGGAGNDSLNGGIASADTQGGADTLVGGLGIDAMAGGAGADVFAFSLGDSPATQGLDQILDWQAVDRLSLGGAAIQGSTYLEQSASDFSNALTIANALIASGINYVAVQVGNDVIVFADSANDNGTADDGVVLAGRSLADIDAGNFI